jgi:broad specificity phosphatase PhoE
LEAAIAHHEGHEEHEDKSLCVLCVLRGEIERELMAYLILVKHSAPAVVPGVPAREWRLSGLGQQLCDRLADRLAPYRPTVIVTSREPKAEETGHYTGALLGVPIHAADGLHEHERRTVAFMGDQEQFETTVALFFAAPDTLVFGEETANGAYARFAAAVDAVLAAYPDQTVVIVAHGTVISLWMAHTTGIAPFPLWQRLGLPSFVVLSRPDMDVLSIVDDVNASDKR